MPNRSLARTAPVSIVLTLSALALSDAAPAQGASFTVDATHDAVDASPGDGICADAGGACTLRAAVMETNALPGADIVSMENTLCCDHSLSITGAGEDGAATGDLDVTDDLIINGFTQISGDTASFSNLDGGEFDRVFHVDPLELGINVEIRGFVIRRGATIDLPGGPNPNGGAILNQGTLSLYVLIEASRVTRAGLGGGIYNSGTLDLNGVSVTSSSAAQDGGAVYNTGDMSVIDSAFGGNSTELGRGGGIYNAGTASVAESFINGNEAAASGGGVFNSGTLTLGDDNINGNTAPQGGGGIYNEGTLTVTGSTVSGNTVTLIGGGMFNAGSDVVPSPFGVASLTNSTISSNTGGGIVTGRAMSLLNVTIANNSGVGLQTGPFGGQTLKNTLVGNNSAEDCAGVPGLTSQGHNLDSDGTCGFTGPGDQSSVDPLIGPLADNGGPTRTHALIQGGCPTDACIVPSPAIDAGDTAACPATDQRGEPRPFDGDGDGTGECDIGAYEVQEPPLTCTGPCGPIPTSSPTTPSSPTSAAPSPISSLPTALPATGGDAGSPSAIPFAVAGAAALVAAGGAVWRSRRGGNRQRMGSE